MRHIMILFITAGLLLSTLCSWGVSEESATRAVIFMYHRFGENNYPSTNIRTEQFEEQLTYLKKNNFNVIPLDQLVEALKARKPLPDKTIAITIDDAYRSVYEVAFPRFKKYNFPFTVFIAPQTVDDGIAAYMDWQQIREMHASGVIFANHSLNHDYLVRRKAGESGDEWAKRMRADIENAQQRLVDELGSAPLLFAYPYGEYNVELMSIVDELGYTAFGQHSGGVGTLSDMRALPRFPIAEAFAAMPAFKTKALSLPMPVVKQDPINPPTEDKRPALTLELAPSVMNLEQLACYFGSEKLEIEWLNQEHSFRIQAKSHLPAGRSRYNCTAPHLEGKRYFWFSHQWIRASDG